MSQENSHFVKAPIPGRWRRLNWKSTVYDSHGVFGTHNGLLAGVREGQERFGEAADHWKQVARIRSQEPTGFLGQARCLIKADQPDQARKVLQHLLGQEWPSRFENVHDEAEKLLKSSAKSSDQ